MVASEALHKARGQRREAARGDADARGKIFVRPDGGPEQNDNARKARGKAGHQAPVDVGVMQQRPDDDKGSQKEGSCVIERHRKAEVEVRERINPRHNGGHARQRPHGMRPRVLRAH